MAHEFVRKAVIEGLYRYGVRSRLTPIQAMELKRLGVDGQNEQDVPREAWMQCLELTAKYAYPELSPGEAFRQLGRDTVEGMLWGKLWGIMAKAAPIMGPELMLSRGSTLFASGDNFTRIVVNKTGERAYNLTVTGQPLAYAAGLIEASLAATKVKELCVELVGIPISNTGTFRVSRGKS